MATVVGRAVHITTDRFYIRLASDTWQWCAINFKNVKLTRKCPAPNQIGELVLLKDLGGGADGRVWMACTPSGQICAIKFAHREKGDSRDTMLRRLQQEAANWIEANEQPAFVTQLAQEDLLVMPFVEIAEEKTSDPAVQVAVKELCFRLARRGFVHGDVHWRHVGFVPTPMKKNTNGPPEAIFIDLATIEKNESFEVEELVGKMMEMLDLDVNI